MGIRRNIIKLRKQYNLTQEELAKIADVSRGAVSQWEGGFSEPRMGSIQRIADHFGIRKSDLIEDDGIFSSDVENLPPGALRPRASEYATLPLLGRVHAGDAQEPDVFEDVIELPKSVADRHPSGYFLEVEGHCMNKVYPEGCYILIDKTVEPKNGSIAVVSIDGADFVMRRLYQGANTMILSPESWDDSYEDIVMNMADEHTVEFSGTVVWFQASKEME